jgi:hypothetical protein
MTLVQIVVGSSRGSRSATTTVTMITAAVRRMAPIAAARREGPGRCAAVFTGM